MPVTDLRRFTKDAGRAGENVARTIRIIAKVLLDWSMHYAEKKALKSLKGSDRIKFAGSDKALSHLTAIEFDKLTTLFCRIWDRLHEESKVRFRAAFLLRRGFHGAGRAMKINRKEDKKFGKDQDDMRHNHWAYMTEIVEKLKPALSDTRILFSLDKPSWHPKCKVYPALDPSLWDSWLASIESEDFDYSFLTASEVNYVLSISKAISQLEKKEIRALGTHCNAVEAHRDISYNFKAFTDRFNEVITYLEQGTNDLKIDYAAYKMVTIAREVLRKSKDNRKAYETARKKCTAALQGHNDVLNTFSVVHHLSKVIWDDAFISKVGKNAQLLVDFSVYFRRGSATSKLSNKEIREAEEAYERLHAFDARKNIQLPDYQQIETLPLFQWADVLSRVMDEILSCLPFPGRPRQLGVP